VLSACLSSVWHLWNSCYISEFGCGGGSGGGDSVVVCEFEQIWAS
jgi:hypothetical protein